MISTCIYTILIDIVEDYDEQTDPVWYFITSLGNTHQVEVQYDESSVVQSIIWGWAGTIVSKKVEKI